MTERSEWESLRERVLSEKGESSKGRVRFSEGLKASVSEFTLGCSESQEEVAKRLGVSHSALYAWVFKRHGRVRRRTKAPGLRRVSIVETKSEERLELVFPSGARVQGLRLAQLSSLLGAAK